MSQYNSSRVYEEAFKMKFRWEDWLPDEVFQFHNYLYKAQNTPIGLQMGVLLPFVSSLCGPRTKCTFLNTPSVLNLFWLNVGASGIGKTQARRAMIADPMKYILQHTGSDQCDFVVSKFTAAGMFFSLHF